MAAPDFSQFGTLADQAKPDAPDFAKFGTPVADQSKPDFSGQGTKLSLDQVGAFQPSSDSSAAGPLDNAWDFAKDTVLSSIGLESDKSTSTGGDFGRALGKGATVDVVQTVQGINEMAKQTPLGMLADALTPTFAKQLRDSADEAIMAAVNRRGNTLSNEMTDASKASNQKSFFGDEASWANLSKDGIANVPSRIADLVSQGKFFGSGWGDWRKVGLSATESAPVSVLSMLPVIGASKTAHDLALAKALAAGSTEAEAKTIATNAAKNTASAMGAFSEGATGAGQQWTQTYEQVMDMPQAKLDASPQYQQALAHLPPDWTPERRQQEARKAVARAASNTAAVVAGVSDALFAGFGDRYLGGAVAGEGGRVRSMAMGALGETTTELLQSGAEQFGTNLGIQQNADPTQSLTDQVGEQAVGGGLSGGLMGMGFGGAAHTHAEPAAAAPGQATQADEVLGTADAAEAVAAPAQTPSGSPVGPGDGGGIESMLADPKALFAAVTQRPAIFGTIEQAIAAMPEFKAAPPKQQVDVAAALKEMEADPKAIFAIATSQPELYQTIAKAAAQTERLARNSTTSPAPAKWSDAATEQPAPESAPTAGPQSTTETAPAGTPMAQPDDVSAQTDAAYAQREAAAAKQRAQEEQAARDQAMRDRYQQEMARAEAADSGLRPENQVPKTALQLELERLGLTPDRFRSAEDQADARAAEAEQTQVMGRIAADHSDPSLQFLAKSGSPAAQAFAQDEIGRRAAEREAGPTTADQPMMEKLFAKQPLNRDETRRAMELGFGYQKQDGTWALTHKAREYRDVLRTRTAEGAAATAIDPSQALLRRNSDATDEALVSRLNARIGGAIRLAAPSEVPVSADARAGVKIASSFGKRVVFIHTLQRIAGLVLPEDANTIYVNVRSSHPALPIIGHELLHTLRRTNGAIYSALHARVMPMLQNVPEYRAWMKEALTAEGQELTDAELSDLSHEELIADFMGDHMMTSAFWAEVFRGQDKSWVEKIRAAVQLALDALRIRLSIGGKRGFGSEAYVKNVDGVRRAMAEAFNAWSREAEQKQEARRSTRVAENQARSPSGQREAGVMPGRGAALPRQPAMASRTDAPNSAAPFTARERKQPSAGLQAIQKHVRQLRGVDVKAASPAGKALDIRNQSLIDRLAHQAATSPKNDLPQPTERQKAAGNYTLGHVRIAGLNISIENPEGSTRSGTDPNGKPWTVTMKSHYGFLRGTIGRDKDHIDVFVKPGTPQDYTGPVFVIDQRKPGNGRFDESKVMLGWSDMPSAKAGYLENYRKGWDGIRAITRFDNPEALRAWLDDGDTKQPAAPAVLRAREDHQTPMWFSAFARKVEEKAPHTASPIVWKLFIAGLKNQGVKPDEVQWSGVNDWLDLQQGKVAKQAVLDYLRENGVQVEEVMLGIGTETPTKFNRPDLVLPGGENYRELLLTLPSAIEGWRVVWKSGLPNRFFKNKREADDRAEKIGGTVLPRYKAGAPKSATPYAFVSDHFDQPNILAHVRFNERLDSTGNKVLFLEEVQSDWGQAGREHGFGSPAVQPPSAPFVTKTEAWVALSLKRVIGYAAENGFDRIAWTTGEQQAKRYKDEPNIDGDKLDHIEVTDMGNGLVEVSERSLGGKTDVSRVQREELPDIVGDVMAVRVLDDLKEKRLAKYKFPEDFPSPSEKRSSGMRVFYDKIVPNVANDLLRKLGGDRVKQIDILIDEQSGRRRPKQVVSSQPGFEITPALRASAMGGMPLFARERTSPGYKFEPRLELEKQSSGDWMSPDGRYEILREPDGYWASVDGTEIGWGRDYAAARAHLLRAFQNDLADGRIKNPNEAKAVLNRYTPEQRAAVIDVWEKIASLPGAFRFGQSESKDIHFIARDLGVDRMIADITHLETDDHSAFQVKFIDGTYGLLNVDAATKTAYLDAGNMRQGGYGARLYQIALTWAANNKYVLVPDPGGLSLVNTYRRTEQMLSAALRLGTTKYMRPHPDQGLYGWINDASTQADEDHNLALLFLTSYENVMQLPADDIGKVIEELRRLRYNFARERFENADGKPISAQRWMDLSEAHESRDLGLGSSTIQRAVLTQSILAEANHRSGKGLAALVRATPANAILENGHPLRDILYARSRDPRSGQVAGASGPGAREMFRALALGAARGAVKASRPVTFALDAANRGIEAAIRLPAKLLVAPVTSRLYDRVVGIGRTLAQKNPVVQEIAHGLVADYGLPEPYLDARQERDSRIQAVLRKSKDLIDQIASLTRAEARIAYLWMQEAPSSDVEAQLLAQLPESSRQTLAEMKQQIDTFGQEAVRLGLLAQESYDRNHQAYLHRTYKKHELENPNAVARGQKAKSIRADAYRGRGLKDDVAASRLPGVTQGAKYNRMELRDPGSNGQLGKLKRVVYMPAGQPIPQSYAGWRNDGVWEARWMPTKAGDPVGMWRDMSPEERERLGEIDEVRYAFARTMLATTRDIETARFLDWVRRTYSKPSEEAVAEAGQRVSAAVDAVMTAKTYADDQWVQVPQTLVQGSKIKKYGALAGQYLPGHIWNDIRSTMNFRSESAAWRLYDELLRAWKISKTAMSPIVHTNNVMSNFILADMADVRHEHIRQALRTVIDAQRGDEAARTIMERFYASGAEGGSQSMIELRTEIIEPMLAELAREENETLATVSTLQALSMAAHGNLRQSLAALAAKRATKLAAWPFKAMIDAYRSEDSVFRLAKFLKETAAGKTDREAGKEARIAFLDYNINAPWIQAMRRGPLPFISFSYRAIPLLIQAAAKRPEKMMKYFAVGYALNALAYAMLGGAGDEDRERKLMPDEKSGWALGIFYRMLRMPWNDEHGSPVFLDVRRWIPGGDIMDLTGSKSAVPLPQWLSVGGPLSLFIELAANKDLFTGKPIVKESDTAGEQIVKLTDHMFKFIAPNLPLPNPAGYAADAALQERGLFQSYSWKAIQAAITGETDAAGRPRDLGRAILSSAGVKVTSQPEDLAKRNLRLQRDAQLREINETVSGLRRQAQAGGLTTEQLRQRIERQNAKRREITGRLNERMGLQRIN